MMVFLQICQKDTFEAPLTNRMPGLKKYQHAFHHSQKM